MPVLRNPFRTPEVLQKHKAVRIKAFVQAARGVSFHGVDAKAELVSPTQVTLWLGIHVAALAILYLFTPQLPAHLRAAFGYDAPSLWQQLRGLLLLSALASLAGLYASLYASDPGWLSDKLPGLPRGGDAFCNWCGCAPSARCKHSKHTGQCVHKFDHFCWLLATDVGDRNHARFWAYLVLQVSLLCWALHVAMATAWACSAPRSSAPEYCHARGGGVHFVATFLLSLFMVASLAFFGYLLLLHTYLLLTNQTTYEVLRGARHPALAAAYQRHPGRRAYCLPQQLPRLFLDDLLGRGPPKPFSLGVIGNIRQFFVEPWPRQYGKPTPSPQGGEAEMARLLADNV